MAYSPEEIKAAGLHDFRRFLIEVWAYLTERGEIPSPDGRPVRPTPVQMDIAYWLQHEVRDRVILQAFRGVGKSYITVAYVLWLLLLNPQLKIMVVSANEQAAADFTKFAKQLIEGMEILQHLRPRVGQRDSTTAFDVGPAAPSKNPSLKSVGITGQLTGSRADIIIPDDIEVPKNTLTHAARLLLSNRVKEFGAVLKPGGRVIYLGTPQVEESVYVKLVKERGYVTRIWPVQIPEDPGVYKGMLGPLIQKMLDEGAQPGDLVDPKRFDRDEITKRRLEYGAAGFALQFMLDTSLQSIEQFPLKLKNLIITHIDDELAPIKMVWGMDRERSLNDLPAGGFDGDGYYAPVWKSSEMAPFTGTVMYIDPSGTGKDETAYAIVKVLHSLLYLVAVGGFRDGFAEATLRSLAVKSLRHQVNYIVIEKNYGSGMFDQLLKPWLSKVAVNEKGDPIPDARIATIDDEYKAWSKGQKELRILDTLEPIVASHRLIVDRRVIEEDWKVQQENPEYSFVQQFTRMWRQKGALPHEDRVEAVAGACGYWADRMSQDLDRAVDTHKEEARERELRKFMESVGVGTGADEYRWN